ncbi:MAG: SDR family NAD(P)-dependent oxidoreductase [Acidimicrobiales bacterium]|jgi:citronellol/citronellal dehydrogenase
MSGQENVLAGRRVLVTGASRGIGAAFAERAAAAGADLAIVARTRERHDHLSGSLNETAERLKRYGHSVAVITADLSDGAARERIVPEAVEALGGPIDVLVNDAAAAIYAPLLDYTLRRREITFEVNVQAPMDLIQAVLPTMIKRGEGWIVNLSSATARLVPGPPFDASSLWPTMAVYGASKAALNRLTNGLGHALWGTGVRVNTVQPRTGVVSEGAEELVGKVVDTAEWESMEEMVEGILALCDCPEDTTGGLHVSTELVARLGRPVRGLDGRPLK